MTQGAIAALALCAACGGSAPPAAAPSASTEAPPSAAAGAKAAADAPESLAQPSSPTTVAPSPAPQPPPPPQEREAAAEPRGGIGAALRVSRAELSRAEGDLAASFSDCSSACHALGSMERATGHLCDLASDHDDRRSCEDAKTKVLRARDRIRSSCGTCPDGPSLDRTAPIPSRP